MKVFNLQCGNGHGFEGWFGSEDEFRDQGDRGLLECPVCGERSVAKLPSAPRLNLGAGEPQAKQEVMSTPDMQMQAQWMRMVRHVMAHTEDVGERFASEARRIHYGECEERGIRGQASREETEALLDEGIGVLPLPVPKGLKGPVQ